MIIRKATITDKEQVLSLMYKFDEYYIKNNLFPDRLLPFVDYQNKGKTFQEVVTDYLTNAKYFVYVAEAQGELIGYICGDVKEKVYRAIPKEGFIEDWFVLEGYRGNGIGKKLYEALMKDFREAQCQRIGLQAYAVNVETIAMYHRMGFMDIDITMVKEMD